MAINGKLNDDELDGVSGGVVFNSSGLMTDDHKNRDNPWEVLDENGNIIVANGREMRFPTQKAAEDAARLLGVDPREENWDWVKGRRGIK